MHKIRALLYTNSPVLGLGFSTALASAEEIEPAEVGGDLSQLLCRLDEAKPEVLLIDVGPDFDCAVIPEIGRRAPKCKILLWVQSLSLEMAHHTRALGVRGILRKESPIELLPRCIAKVDQGELWFERTLLNSLLTLKEVRLSPRERQLVRLISQGLSNKQMAAELLIAEGTIKVYISKLFRKLGVSDRFELALYGLRNFGMVAMEASGHESLMGLLPPSLVIRDVR